MNVIHIEEYSYSISGPVSSNDSHTIFECDGVKRNKNSKEIVRMIFVKNNVDVQNLVKYGSIDKICDKLPRYYSDDELHKTYAEYDIINSKFSLYLITSPLKLDIPAPTVEQIKEENKEKIPIGKKISELTRVALFVANVEILFCILILLIYNKINDFSHPAVGFRIGYYIIILIAAIPCIVLKLMNHKLTTKKYRIKDKKYFLFTSILLSFQLLFLTILVRSDIMIKENISNDTVDETIALTSTLSTTKITTNQTTTTVQESLKTQELTSDAFETVLGDNASEMKKKCDLNGDGKVNEADYKEFGNKYKEYMQGLLTQEEINALDIDGKGSLTTFDGEEIKKYYD